MAAAIWDQSDARENVAETRLIGRHDEVAGERQVAPRSGGDAVDRRDERLLDGADGEDQRVEGPPQAFRPGFARVRGSLARSDALPGFEVRPRAKPAPGACHHHG